MPFCSTCGTELLSGAAFCSKCGTAVVTGSTPPYTPPGSSTPTATPAEVPFRFHAGAFFGGLFVVLGFFSPWVSLVKFGIDVDGPNALNIGISSIKAIFGDTEGKLFFIVLVVCLGAIIVSGISCIAYGATKQGISDSEFAGTKNGAMIALVVIGVMLVIVVNKFSEEFGIKWEDEYTDLIIDALGRGFWLTFFGALILAFSSPRRKP